MYIYIYIIYIYNYIYVFPYLMMLFSVIGYGNWKLTPQGLNVADTFMVKIVVAERKILIFHFCLTDAYLHISLCRCVCMCIHEASIYSFILIIFFSWLVTMYLFRVACTFNCVSPSLIIFEKCAIYCRHF